MVSALRGFRNGLTEGSVGLGGGEFGKPGLDVDNEVIWSRPHKSLSEVFANQSSRSISLDRAPDFRRRGNADSATGPRRNRCHRRHDGDSPSTCLQNGAEFVALPDASVPTQSSGPAGHSWPVRIRPLGAGGPWPAAS